MNRIVRETWYDSVDGLIQNRSRQLAWQIQDVRMAKQFQSGRVFQAIHNRHGQNPAKKKPAVNTHSETVQKRLTGALMV